MKFCAPDIPFWETVSWHLKQLLAVSFIVGTAILFAACCYAAYKAFSR